MEDRSNEHSNDRRTDVLTDRIEMKVRRERHRRWSAEDKLRIVRESLQPGTGVQAVSDRYGIGNGLLYTWRKQMLATAMAGFTPVQVAGPALPSPAKAKPPDVLQRAIDGEPAAAAGRIEIELPGGARVRVANGFDLKLLGEALALLDGR
jgi:transposase